MARPTQNPEGDMSDPGDLPVTADWLKSVGMNSAPDGLLFWPAGGKGRVLVELVVPEDGAVWWQLTASQPTGSGRKWSFVGEAANRRAVELVCAMAGYRLDTPIVPLQLIVP